MFSDTRQPWLLDASALLNLAGMSRSAEVLRALQVPWLAPSPVLREFKRNPRPEDHGRPLMARLEGLIGEHQLDDAEFELFGELVGAAPPDDLGDGEAAVLAVANYRNLSCIIDDSKPRRVARERFPSVQVYSSVEILARAAKLGTVPPGTVRECLIDALTYSRMSVQSDWLPWVGEMIHPEPLAKFPSLRRRLRERR